jgi:hypothetical protein
MTTKPRLKRDWIGRRDVILLPIDYRPEGEEILPEVWIGQQEVSQEFDDHLKSMCKLLGCASIEGAANPRLALSSRIALAILTLQERANMQSVGQWIPVASRLPQFGSLVLIRFVYPDRRPYVGLGICQDEEYWHKGGDPTWLLVPRRFVSHWCLIPDYLKVEGMA